MEINKQPSSKSFINEDVVSKNLGFFISGQINANGEIYAEIKFNDSVFKRRINSAARFSKWIHSYNVKSIIRTSITPLFHSGLKTHLFLKSFPP